jgi:L,D-peptidoglycan transpeptidase YkuD (ErfK/YbiS/YcfS/YnhG family)
MIFTAFSDGMLAMGSREVKCALGPAGVTPAASKREGDGATPVGVWPIRRVLYRPDRGGAPATLLPVEPIDEHDGWCDAADDPAYNRPVTLPYPASAEHMWREDGLYDLCVILGHNDDPVVSGAGSAIFLHCAHPDYHPTHGCIALARQDLEGLLEMARPGDAVAVVHRSGLGRPIPAR